MFGLASLPLTQRFLHKLDVVQRRMLRSIVGWVRIPDEPWENTMRRMNQRMEHAAYLHPLPSWSNQYFKSQYRLATKIVSNQFSWAATAVAWMPLDDWVHNFPSAPSRSRGRPPKRWDQALASFSCTYFGERNWWVAAQNCNQWLAAEAAFVKYCESMWRTKGSPCPFRIEVTRTGERKKESCRHFKIFREIQVSKKNGYNGIVRKVFFELHWRACRSGRTQHDANFVASSVKLFCLGQVRPARQWGAGAKNTICTQLLFTCGKNSEMVEEGLDIHPPYRKHTWRLAGINPVCAWRLPSKTALHPRTFFPLQRSEEKKLKAKKTKSPKRICFWDKMENETFEKMRYRRHWAKSILQTVVSLWPQGVAPMKLVRKGSACHHVRSKRREKKKTCQKGARKRPKNSWGSQGVQTCNRCGRGCWPWWGHVFQIQAVETFGAILLFRTAPVERLCTMPMCHWREALKLSQVKSSQVKSAPTPAGEPNVRAEAEKRKNICTPKNAKPCTTYKHPSENVKEIIS